VSSWGSKNPLVVTIKKEFAWTRASYAILSSFFLVLLLIVIVWWPLVEEYTAGWDANFPFWMQVDWLLIGIFAAMTLLIMAGADIKRDAWIALVGLAGGLVIESWGTQTHLWTYFTYERPPLWIIPAWPIASLSIDRIARILNRLLPTAFTKITPFLYWPVFLIFFGSMLVFVLPTLNKTLTIFALLTCAGLIISPGDRRMALIQFIAGTGLGYFLEVWGTTRACWTYYTFQTPPLFAVLAHGLAAVAFWRSATLLAQILHQWKTHENCIIEPTEPNDLPGQPDSI
jgi:hypothetical protein